MLYVEDVLSLKKGIEAFNLSLRLSIRKREPWKNRELLPNSSMASQGYVNSRLDTHSCQGYH